MNKFSVVTSVYSNDKPELVIRALDSVTLLQTSLPDEIVIVVDGPVSNVLSTLLDEYAKTSPVNIRIIRLPQNGGLGNALKIAVEVANNEIIARMDSDDVSLPDRFDKQMTFLVEHPEYDIVGGQMTEFIEKEDNIVGKREVPCTNEEIYRNLKRRCPFNHVTVMFKKASVLGAGNYMDWHYNEDYYLWIRMAESGCRFANLPDTLVNVRVGVDMYCRRGGWRYFISEKGLQDYMLKKSIISLPQYLFNVGLRFMVQVAIPNRLRGYIFQKFIRSKN